MLDGFCGSNSLVVVEIEFTVTEGQSVEDQPEEAFADRTRRLRKRFAEGGDVDNEWPTGNRCILRLSVLPSASFFLSH